MSKCYKGGKIVIFKIFNDGKKITLNNFFFNRNLITLMERRFRKTPRQRPEMSQ